jgi:lipopolysaccharide export LptBFGC system permease protein LptF
MRITTPLTIWGFLLGQLLKLLLLTAVILVVVLSFVGAVRMFANGTLGVVETLMLAGWLTVPMLQYALPFAGGFAATLAYHRMSQDNELTAVYAGGISHKTILLPTAALGLLMGVAMFAMADQVMPRFLRSAQEMITADPSRLLAGRLGKGQSLALDRGRKLLFADDVSEVEPRAGELAFKHLLMRGVVALELDDAGNIVREVSSPVADVWLYHEADAPALTTSGPAERWNVSGGGGESTTAVMELRHPVGGEIKHALAYVEQTVVAYKLPSTFRDRAKFLTWSELDRAWTSPERLTAVEDQRRLLAQMLAERTAIDAVRAELKRVGRATLVDGAGRPVMIRATGIEASPSDKGFALTPAHPGSPIEVTVVGSLAGDAPDSPRSHIHRAQRAYLGQPSAAVGSGTSLTLVMDEVSTTTGSDVSDTAGVLTTLSLQGLRPSSDPLRGYLEATPDSLRAQAGIRAGTPDKPDAPLARQSAALGKEIDSTRREIRGKQHERIATSLSCIVMVLLGAVMGMRLGSASPLTVYVWSFLPALLGEVAISGGQTMVVQHGAPGLILLYGGVLAVAVLTLFHYRLLARH